MARKSQLERKGEEVIAALLSCGTLCAAAERAGVSESSIARWLREPEFNRAYREARRAALEVSLHAVARASTTAIATLLLIMKDADSSAGARVSAAGKILDLAMRFLEVDDIEARLDAVEAAQEREEDGE